MAVSNRLRPLSEGEIPSEYLGVPEPPGTGPTYQPPQQPRGEAVAASVLLTALRALSQRSLIAIGNLFTLTTAASAWWLWYVTMPTPSVLQLVGLTLYGVLILALNWLVLRRRG